MVFRFLQLTLGIRLAKLTSLPESVLARATQVSEMLNARARQRNASSKTRILGERRRLILQLHETLKQAADGNMDNGVNGEMVTSCPNSICGRLCICCLNYSQYIV